MAEMAQMMAEEKASQAEYEAKKRERQQRMDAFETRRSIRAGAPPCEMQGTPVCSDAAALPYGSPCMRLPCSASSYHSPTCVQLSLRPARTNDAPTSQFKACCAVYPPSSSPPWLQLARTF